MTTAEARAAVLELDAARERMYEAYRYRRFFPLFSAERREADVHADMLAQEYKALRKKLSALCWRCYGTGKPLNGEGDTLEIFAECPACDRTPEENS